MKSTLAKKTARILLSAIIATLLSVTTIIATVFAEGDNPYDCSKLVTVPDATSDKYAQDTAAFEKAKEDYTKNMEACAKSSTEYYFKEKGVTQMFETDNLCMKTTEELAISTVIEEPMDIAGGKGADNNGVEVRNCVRNTVCAIRTDKGARTTDCISTLNKEGVCEKQTDDIQVTCNPVQVFLSDSGTNMLFFYISAIYRWAASIVGIVAVLVIVVSGIQISAAGGDQQVVTSARGRIVQSILGIVVLFLSAIILYSINPTFFTR